jgi:hypothetical protein
LAAIGPHSYPGIVYGSRHFALAVPALVAAIAIGLGGVLSEAASGASDPSNSPGDASRVARATAVRAGTLALIVHTAVFALPPLLREYGSDYREASGAVREASSRQQLTHALVFVHSDRWGWKSAFPLNDYPLESNDVLYAQDLGRRNAELRSAFPARPAFRARFLKGGRVRLFPLRNDPDAGLIPGRDASRR